MSSLDSVLGHHVLCQWLLLWGCVAVHTFLLEGPRAESWAAATTLCGQITLKESPLRGHFLAAVLINDISLAHVLYVFLVIKPHTL